MSPRIRNLTIASVIFAAWTAVALIFRAAASYDDWPLAPVTQAAVPTLTLIAVIGGALLALCAFIWLAVAGWGISRALR